MTDRIPPQNTDRSKSVDHAMRQADIVSRARLATPITATSGRDILRTADSFNNGRGLL